MQWPVPRWSGSLEPCGLGESASAANAAEVLGAIAFGPPSTIVADLGARAA